MSERTPRVGGGATQCPAFFWVGARGFQGATSLKNGGGDIIVLEICAFAIQMISGLGYYPQDMSERQHQYQKAV